MSAKYEPDIHHRRSVRLPIADYGAAGAYFLTICTQNREHLFGEITDREIRLSDAVCLAAISRQVMAARLL
jgi:putative transposase